MTNTIGHDVEFILTREGNPVSSIGLIGGSKDFPRPCNLGALQEDNVLAEINILPATTVEEWERNNKTVVQELQSLLPPGIVLSTAASAFYSRCELSDPKALEFGCDPDMNAWSRKFNKFKTLSGKFKALRSAGGHVHVGIPDMDIKSKFNLIRCMDAFIGQQTVLLDKDKERKRLYGKAGAMRLKPYGVEWRVPSNFWIHSEYDRTWMFEAAMFCADNFSVLEDMYKQKSIVTTINTNNALSAAKNLNLLYALIEFPLHKDIPR